MRPFILLIVLLSLGSCGNREVLLPLPAENPAGVTFAGQWRLSDDPRQLARRINAAIRQTDGVSDRIRIVPRQGQEQQAPRTPRRVDGGLVHVFFEDGESLKITQTPYALFVSFDRAVVEEYRFGEDRLINVGQAEAQRVSGWENGDYVIKTLGRNGMKLTERYRLAPGGNELLRRITFRSRSKEAITIDQHFVRES